MLVLFISAPLGLARVASKVGVYYFEAPDGPPSYLHLLTPSDQAEVERAKANIERYRKSNITITVVDGNGKPLQGVEVAFNHTDHNFLFGFNDFDPFLFGSAVMLREAGFNLFVAATYWSQIEPDPDQYKWNFVERQQLEDIRSLGFRIKVHPIVYYDPEYGHVIPTFLKSLKAPEIENETLTFVNEVLSTIPSAEIYELSNEAHHEWGRGGLTIDQYIGVVAEAASMIRTVNRNATLTVNTDHTFGEHPGGEPEYRRPDLSPYDWYKLLIDEGLDFDAVGVQFRPGYLNPVSFGSVGYEQNRVLSLTEVSKKFDRLAGLGKRVHITEFAVPSHQLPLVTRYGQLDWNDAMQAAYVEGFYTLIFGKPAADSLTWWFITTGMPTSDEDIGPRPFERQTSSLLPKLSYYTLRNLIRNRWSTRGLGYTDAGGRLTFTGFGGTYALGITYDGVTKTVDISVADGASSSHQITFDRAEILRDEQARRTRLQGQAHGLLQELDRIWQWSKTVNQAKSSQIEDMKAGLTHLYEQARYEDVLRSGVVLLDNPLQINISGRLSDFGGFAPLLLDPVGDTDIGTPPGTDLAAIYGFADLSNLYLGMRVHGDQPDQNPTFTVEIRSNVGIFHAAVGWNIYSDPPLGGQPVRECSCFQQPWEEGGVNFGCAYMLGEMIQMRVPLKQLKLPEKIYLNSAFIWRETPQGPKAFDASDGPIELPSLAGFQPETQVVAEATETATTTLQSPSTSASTIETVPVTTGRDLLPYVGVACALVILGVALYWRRKRNTSKERIPD